MLWRGRDRARHILLDKRAQMRRMLGRHRVAYRVTAIEVIASFRFNREDKLTERLNQEAVTQVVAAALEAPLCTSTRNSTTSSSRAPSVDASPSGT